MMRKEIMAKTAQLEEFDEALYKVRRSVADVTDEGS
jgi:seryl-tRNA synthetase